MTSGWVAMCLVLLVGVALLAGCESSPKAADDKAAKKEAAAFTQPIDRPDLAPDMLLAIADRDLLRGRGLTSELLSSSAVDDDNRAQAARDAYTQAARYYLAFAERIGHGDDVANAKLHAAEALIMSGRSAEAVARLKELIPAPTTTPAVRAEGLYWIGIAYLKLGDALNADLSHQRLAYEFPNSPWAEWAHVGGAPAGIPMPDDVERETPVPAPTPSRE